jgi:hypothetical protein
MEREKERRKEDRDKDKEWEFGIKMVDLNGKPTKQT